MEIPSESKIMECAKKFNLFDETKKREIVDRRFYIFNLLYKHKITSTEIGCRFNKNHATVLNGLKKCEMLKKDKQFIRNIKDVKEYLFPTIDKLSDKEKEELFKLELKSIMCKFNAEFKIYEDTNKEKTPSLYAIISDNLKILI